MTDLDPKWITPNLFIFRCPHCSKDDPKAFYLSCKNIVMSTQGQFDIFGEKIGEDWNLMIVPCKEEFAWNFSGSDFSTLTVTPSIDASNSGHWHGNINNGEATP